MSNWNRKFDIRMTDDGDWMWGNGDFATIKNEACAAQNAYASLHTEIYSNNLWPNVGHDILEEIGGIVDATTLPRIKEKIVECITRFDRIPRELVLVSAKMLNDAEAELRVGISIGNGRAVLLPTLIFSSAGIRREE